MVDHRSSVLRFIWSHSLYSENQAQKHRHEVKEEATSIQGYMRYPATLIIKRPREKI